jgi:hypothetical protein
MQLKPHYEPRPKEGLSPLVRIDYDKWLKNVDEKCEEKRKIQNVLVDYRNDHNKEAC